MLSVEEKIRWKLLKRMHETLGIVMPVAFVGLIAYFIIFKNVPILYTFIAGVISYALLISNYYLSFKKKSLKFEYSLAIFMLMALSSMAIFSYFAGGSSGPIIPIFFLTVIMFSMLLNPEEATLFSFSVTIIYLIFFFGEAFGIIIPLERNVNLLNISRVLVNITCLFAMMRLGVIVSQNVGDSVKFYKLRNLRLTNIKKKLEILVGKRTVQLEDSNRKLKKAEGSLRKNYTELKKLDVKKDEFISIAAHELKTPLTVMSGYANLLKDEKVIRNQNKRKRFLDIIEDESKRQAQLVSEILDLSRIDLGVMKYVIEELNLYEFIKSLEDQFGPKIKENGLSYEFRIEDKLPKIETDKEKLYEILMNLINNAIKFTSEGKITVKIERNGDYIQFSVADTGIGISRKYYNKLFTRFFQVDSSYTRSVGGTGLGLSLCKEYTEKLGGDIWLKSKVGKGTTFYFRIPIKTTVKKNIIKIK